MKIGLISDTHLTSSTDMQQDILDIASVFKQTGVTDIVHLGDIVDDSELSNSDSTYTEILMKFEDIFSDFNTHYTLGNHDSELIKPTQFETELDTSLNTCIYETQSTAFLIVNTGTKVRSDGTELPCGAIAREGLKLIETYLDKDTLYIATHYPLQYTPLFQTKSFFDIRPEYTFPVNKLELEQRLQDCTEQPQITVYCGHLHPPENICVSTKPHGITLQIRRPLKQFDTESYEMTPAVKDISDFIVTVE